MFDVINGFVGLVLLLGVIVLTVLCWRDSSREVVFAAEEQNQIQENGGDCYEII